MSNIKLYIFSPTELCRVRLGGLIAIITSSSTVITSSASTSSENDLRVTPEFFNSITIPERIETKSPPPKYGPAYPKIPPRPNNQKPRYAGGPRHSNYP